MNLTIASLDPTEVWTHFDTLCAIPRMSKHEAALRGEIVDWARARGLASQVDAAGNLVLRKPATPGREHLPGVILQAHLDMVCQKNRGTDHDFTRDPIRPVLDGGWLVARDTTLGADNGIGVALALAALADTRLAHPALEVLLTVDEEAGMGGARALTAGSLLGRRLINLDTEEWGEFYLGCAGGMDVVVHHPGGREPRAAGWPVWRLEVSGLQGGHSGIDIHLGRGNAIRLLAETVHALATAHGAQLITLEGGTARNAIPREAQACIALPPEAGVALSGLVNDTLARWHEAYAGVDESLDLRAGRIEAPSATVMTADAQAAVLDFLRAAPNGVQAWSGDFDGVVETSLSLGVARIDESGCEAVFMLRSLRDAHADALAGSLCAIAAAHGFASRRVGPYPGWRPDPGSALLAAARTVYRRRFGHEAGLRVIHAGLECGLIAASHPGLDMLSFGPDIRGAHAPGEQVRVASVGLCWDLLRDLLAALD